MITENEMYWLTRMDHIRLLLVVFGLALISMFSWLPPFVWYGLMGRKTGAWPIFASAFFTLFAVVCFIGHAFIPTTKEWAAIKVVPLIANDEDVRGIGNNLLVLSKEWIDELRPVQDKGNESGQIRKNQSDQNQAHDHP